MDKQFLEYLLIRGTKIPYMGVGVRQPTIKDLDECYINFNEYKYIYCLIKDFLQFEDGENIEDFKDYTYFQTLFKMKNKIYLQILVLSLGFFIEVKVENIQVSTNDIVIHNDEDKILFILDDSNFEEFAELIRLICCCEKMVVNEPQKVRKYKDSAMQQKYEALMLQLHHNETRKKQENELTTSDIIGAICVNGETKYNYRTIEELTIWQLYYTFIGTGTKENIEILKLQFASGNYKFDKVPDMNWTKKVKVRLPEDTKLINKNKI